MKKIIAAALSILVGAFGYTIVDTTLETRVSVLESEMQELREEVSNHHTTGEPINTEVVTEVVTNAEAETEIVTEVKTEIKTEIHTEVKTESHTKPPYSPPNKSDYIGKSIQNNSPSKFLIVVSETGEASYIPPHKYDDYLASLTTSTTTTAPETTVPQIAVSPGEYFVYLTNCSAVITDVYETPNYSSRYDSDYSLVTELSYINSELSFKLTCVGYTDSALAGVKIRFTPEIYDMYGYDVIEYFKRTEPAECVINSDGSFEYTAVYRSPVHLGSIKSYIADLNLNGFSINNVELDFSL